MAKTEDRTKRAVLYTRVSTLDQAREGYSLAAQRKALEAWAEGHGYIVVDLYSDEGISGKDIRHRHAMCAMLDAVRNGGIDLVLVWALSRLTRSVSDLYRTWELLQRHHCALVSYTETFDTSTPTGRAMMGLLGVFAQMEREITAERVKSAMSERAAQGKRTTNEVLGYDLLGSDGLSINEAEAERVRYIFTTYLQTHNLSTVAELCRQNGYYGKRGRQFKAWQIKVILSRPIYIGRNSFCGQTYLGNYPPIIDKSTWDAVQALLNR